MLRKFLTIKTLIWGILLVVLLLILTSAYFVLKKDDSNLQNENLQNDPNLYNTQIKNQTDSARQLILEDKLSQRFNQDNIDEIENNLILLVSVLEQEQDAELLQKMISQLPENASSRIYIEAYKKLLNVEIISGDLDNYGKIRSEFRQFVFSHNDISEDQKLTFDSLYPTQEELLNRSTIEVDPDEV